MIRKQVDFLASRRGFTIRAKAHIRQPLHPAVFSAGKSNDDSALFSGDLHCRQDICRRAACRYRPENVAFSYKRLRLPCKYILVTTVISNRSYYRTVGRQGNSGQRPAIGLEAVY
jgi:hypothetical protein